MDVTRRSSTCAKSAQRFPQGVENQRGTRLITRIVREVTPAAGFEDFTALKVAVYRKLTALRIPFTYAQVFDAIALVESNTCLVRVPAPVRHVAPSRVHETRAIGRGEAARLVNSIYAGLRRRTGAAA
jgi:hypothetical protein